MILKYAPLFLALALSPSCGSEASKTDMDGAAETAMEAEQHLADGQAHVQCGCAIPEIGHCGEYIEVEGAMVELVFPEGMDLGSMPFCGEYDLIAEADGALSEGKFVATSFALLEQTDSTSK